MISDKIAQFITYLQSTALPWILDEGLSIILIVIITAILLWLMDRITNRIILRHIQKTGKSALYEHKRAETLTRTLKNTLKAVIIVVSFILILGQLGVNTVAIVAGAGILAAAIGFGFQSLIKDVISGFFILAENQYRVGDYVTIANLYGRVQEVGLRTTVIRGDDGVIHYIPNGQILLTSNFSRSKSGVYFDISISPKTNINKAIDIINSVGLALSKDKIFMENIVEAPYFARLETFSEQGVMLKVLGETKPNMQWYVSSELRKRILLEFKKNKIQLGIEPSVKTVKDLEETIRRYN